MAFRFVRSKDVWLDAEKLESTHLSMGYIVYAGVLKHQKYY